MARGMALGELKAGDKLHIMRMSNQKIVAGFQNLLLNYVNLI
jgi:hypothetical protein